MTWLAIVPSRILALPLSCWSELSMPSLLIYLNENELLSSVQSAYGQFFSTETAVLKVVTDVLTAMDRGQITLLGMFDLSAAFDTVDHAILLRRLEVSFGIRGVALNWFASYLSGRSQQVSVQWHAGSVYTPWIWRASGFCARADSLPRYVYCRSCWLGAHVWSVCACICRWSSGLLPSFSWGGTCCIATF